MQRLNMLRRARNSFTSLRINAPSALAFTMNPNVLLYVLWIVASMMKSTPKAKRPFWRRKPIFTVNDRYGPCKRPRTLMKGPLVTSFFFLVLSLSTVASAGKNDSLFQAKKDSVISLHNRILKAGSDSSRRAMGPDLRSEVEELLACDGVFEAEFPELSDRMGILDSPDERFRLFHWNLAYNDGTHEYFGYILKPRDDKKAEVIQLEAFQNSTDRDSRGRKKNTLRKPELEKKKLPPRTWIPALYYRIIQKERDGRTFYTLLGWEGKNAYTTRKQIEVLHFDKKGVPHFGMPIFKGQEEEGEKDRVGKKESGERSLMRRRRERKEHEQPKRRVIFEYTDNASLTLNYEADKDRVVFNHLVPKRPDLKGMYEFYEPDLVFNAYVWQEDKGYWKFKEKVEPENEGGQNRPWNDPEE